jgi:transposase
MTLEDFIVDHFGTKELAARRLKVSRFTIYRWLARPEIIQLKHFHKLSQITQTDVHTIIDFCAPRTIRAQDARTRKGTHTDHAAPAVLARRAS